MKDANRFTSTTRDTLVKRALQECSSPSCRLTTSGPHTDEDRAIDVGFAAHIRGANQGSARFDEQITPEERSSISNGIWL